MNPTRNASSNNTKIAPVIHFSTRFHRLRGRFVLGLSFIIETHSFQYSLAATSQLYLLCRSSRSLHSGVIPSSCPLHRCHLWRLVFDPGVRVVSSLKVDQMQTTPR